MNYKAELRIPTSEPYSYISVQTEGTPEGIFEDYSAFQRLVKVGEGLPDKEWRECLDRYRVGKGMDVEHHEKMNAAQKWLIHEIDKSESRLKTKNK